MRKAISSDEVYRGRVVTVRREMVASQSGPPRLQDVVLHPGGVVIVAELEGGVVFVRQHRYVVDEELLELPAGTREPDEAPEVTAARELEEEAGLRAGALEKLAEFYAAPGYCTELLTVYVATELTEATTAAPDEDELITRVRLTREEAVRAAADGRIRDAKTIAALLLYVARAGGR
ncbi:MAG TPA: NUDIX hydrolase [Polyangia bacterium]|jgi:ADP-ribose pyrophosphatase